jgi:hypothetical protein
MALLTLARKAMHFPRIATRAAPIPRHSNGVNREDDLTIVWKAPHPTVKISEVSDGLCRFSDSLNDVKMKATEPVEVDATSNGATLSL